MNAFSSQSGRSQLGMDGDVSGQCGRSLLGSHHRLLQKVVALGEQAPVLVEIKSGYSSIIIVRRMEMIRI